MNDTTNNGHSSLSARLRDFLPSVYKKYGSLNARQYAYRAEAAGLLEKSKTTFNTVNKILVELREAGTMPWSSVLDSSREFSPILIDDSPEGAVARAQRKFKAVADNYYVPKWRGQDVVPVLITEKEGLIPYFEKTTNDLDVSIYPIKGQAGKSHLHEEFVPWAKGVIRGGQALKVIYLGDYDDEGFQIEETLNQTLVEFGLAVVETERLALTKAQVQEYEIKLKELNGRSSIAGKFVDGKAELEAIEPTVLTALIRGAIEACLNPKTLKRTRKHEEKERVKVAEEIGALTAGWGDT